MRKLIVKLKDQTASFIDPTQPDGSMLIFGAVEKEVSETPDIKRGVLGGALIIVSAVDKASIIMPIIEAKESEKLIEPLKKK